MSSSKSGKAPDAPDYLSAAIAQGQLGKEQSLSQTGLNRPNEVTPYGTRTWTYTGGNTMSSSTGGSGGVGNPNAQQPVQQEPVYDPFGGRVMSSTGGGGGSGNSGTSTTSQPYDPSAGRATSYVPSGSYQEGTQSWSSIGGPTVAPDQVVKSTATTEEQLMADLLAQSNASIVNPGDWTVTTELSPEQQALYDQEVARKQQQGQYASTALDSWANQYLGQNGNPNLRNMNVQTTNLKDFNQGAVNPGSLNLQRFQGSNVGLGDLGYTGDSYSAQRQSVEDATFNRAARLLDPAYQQQESDMRSRLANQGLQPGSAAYEREMENFNRSRDIAYQDAADRAVLAGGTEQSRMLSDLLRSRDQDLQNQLAQFDTGMQSSQLNNNYATTEFDRNLQGQLSQFDTGLKANQANNETAQDRFTQGMLANQMNSQYDLQLLDAMMRQRGQTFNEAQALSGGAQASVPQFGSYGMAGGSNPADIMGAMQSGYDATLGQWNANQAAKESERNTALAIMSMFAMSDRRLKSDIRRTGTGYAGLPTYEYEIFGRRETGYMADEVREVMPEAVYERPDGYLMVNYALLGGRP